MSTTCRDCQDLGRVVVATRVVGKTTVCDQHCASRMGTKWTPPTPLSLEAQAARFVASGLSAADAASALANLGFPEKRAEKAVQHTAGIERVEEVRNDKSMQGRKATNLDWAQIQKERDAGASVDELRKKYHTSWPTVAKYTTGSPKNGKSHAGGGAKTTKPTRRGGHFKGATNSTYSLQVTEAGMDALWKELAPEKKAELLKGLW